ncbi:hypothetical protein BH10PSE19_BH10PSE19_16080 [soil metagenome]
MYRTPKKDETIQHLPGPVIMPPIPLPIPRTAEDDPADKAQQPAPQTSLSRIRLVVKEVTLSGKSIDSRIYANIADKLMDVDSSSVELVRKHVKKITVNASGDGYTAELVDGPSISKISHNSDNFIIDYSSGKAMAYLKTITPEVEQEIEQAVNISVALAVHEHNVRGTPTSSSTISKIEITSHNPSPYISLYNNMYRDKMYEAYRKAGFKVEPSTTASHTEANVLAAVPEKRAAITSHTEQPAPGRS